MSAKPPELRLWDLMRGALAARALGIVSDLRVADLLAGGPRPVAELASETGADADTLHRLVRALASDGVFAEDEPGVFRNTDASELLRGGGTWDDFAHFFGGTWHRAAGELETAPEATFPGIFGTRRRLCPLEDPRRLERRAGGCDSRDDSHRRAERRTPDRSRDSHPARQRASGREVARPPDARPRRGTRAGRGAVASLLEGAGFEPVRVEDALIQARAAGPA